MRKTLALLILLTVFACQSLPEIKPDLSAGGKKQVLSCFDFFPKGEWQLVHSIEATLPSGKKGFLMGVTLIGPAPEMIRCAMLTMEGLVLFEAEYDGRLKIHRAVPPFDAAEFADGLMADIRLMFVKPKGEILSTGVLENGWQVYRFRGAKGTTVDVSCDGKSRLKIIKYDFRGKLVRTVVAGFENAAALYGENKIASRLELKAYGWQEYSLRLKLVETERRSP